MSIANVPAVLLRALGINSNNALPIPGVNTNDPGNVNANVNADATAAQSNTPSAQVAQRSIAETLSNVAKMHVGNNVNASATSGIPAMLRGVISNTANNVQPPVPSIDTTSADASNNAVVNNAVSSMTPPTPQLSTRTGIMDGPTPQAGQPYQPLGLLGKIMRVASVAGNVAGRVAPYVGEGRQQQAASEFQQQQDLASQRQAAAESQANFERGITSDANNRAQTLLPGQLTMQTLQNAALQHGVTDYQSPEQKLQLENKYAPTLLPNKMNGTVGLYDPATGSVKMLSNADGTPFSTGSSIKRYAVAFNEGVPYGVSDAMTPNALLTPGNGLEQNAAAANEFKAANDAYHTKVQTDIDKQTRGINASAARADASSDRQNVAAGRRAAYAQEQAINAAQAQNTLVQQMASSNNPADRTALAFKALGLDLPDGVHRINKTELDNVKAIGGLSDRAYGAILNFKSGQQFSPEVANDIAQSAQHIADSKVSNAMQNLHSIHVTYGYKSPRLENNGSNVNGNVNAPPTATGPNGHRIVFTNGAWRDAVTSQVVQ